MIYGILTGCDKNQEWLLPWWWKYYTAHNSYPVAFIDFGMSEMGKKWCQEKGIYLPLLPAKAHIQGKKHLSVEKQSLWEGHYGKKIWSRRRIWFKKPFALLQSPFSFSLWLDLDCQVRKPLEPLFNCLHFGLEIGVKKRSRGDPTPSSSKTVYSPRREQLRLRAHCFPTKCPDPPSLDRRNHPSKF